jgi:hypothetical protein
MSGAQVRMADALLRTLGGRTVLLHIPAPATAGDLGEQIGLATPDFQDVELGPVVFRRVRPRTASGITETVARYELLVSASAVERLVGSLDDGAASVFFAQASSVLADGTSFEITTATGSEAFGSVYLYRLGLRATAADLV